MVWWSRSFIQTQLSDGQNSLRANRRSTENVGETDEYGTSEKWRDESRIEGLGLVFISADFEDLPKTKAVARVSYSYLGFLTPSLVRKARSRL
ncbi:hypothetical protein FNV43_RR16971 [Rhamnella rubrinervis]|uniref:Uncharacterized protein n=1 Tax=Rhamnella rubrinervis TaxID=2594499 RepID=A0A8K0GZT8_9ROSA|nr:hypothetical protein FNV43_RR16971 [Rhamnella rubrinervis]